LSSKFFDILGKKVVIESNNNSSNYGVKTIMNVRFLKQIRAYGGCLGSERR
jgi:hypothetical protein